MTENNKPTIKIFVNYHKPFYLLKNDIFEPIHVGRDIATEISKDGKVNNNDFKWLLNNLIGDNTGENISNKNRTYCELTGLYWVWKNYEQIGNPDYIGFMQYRRHFIFNENLINKLQHSFDLDEKAYSAVRLKFIPDDYIKTVGLDEQTVSEYCSKYDCILPEESQFEYIDVYSLKEDYLRRIEGTHFKDYELMMKTLSELFPKLKDTVYRQSDSSNKYLYQMFIVKKEIFFDYCNILFTTLSKLESEIDMSQYSVNGKRTLGYLGELIFDTYFHYLYDTGIYKFKKLKVTLIENNKSQKKYKKKLAKLRIKKAKYKILKKYHPIEKKRKRYADKQLSIEKDFERYNILKGENNG